MRKCKVSEIYVFLHKSEILNQLIDKCVFAFYTEIQDGRQNWLEIDFLKKKLPHDCADTLGAQNFIFEN